MIISTKGRYAIRTMVELASSNDESFIPLHEIASKQDISKKYLESIVRILIQNGFIEGLSGKGGGYRLNRPASEYTIAQILECVEGRLATIKCVCDDAVCQRQAECFSFPIWEGLQQLIDDYLSNFTLQDLLEKDTLKVKVSNKLKENIYAK